MHAYIRQTNISSNLGYIVFSRSSLAGSSILLVVLCVYFSVRAFAYRAMFSSAIHSDSRVAFMVLRQGETDVRLLRYERNADGKFSPVMDVPIQPTEKSERRRDQIVEGQLSPTGRWLALGLAPTLAPFGGRSRVATPTWLSILDMTTHQPVYEGPVGAQSAHICFAWRSGNTLRFRRSMNGPDGRLHSAVYTVIGPDWKASERMFSGDMTSVSLNENHQQDLRKEAADRLTTLGYRLVYLRGESAMGGWDDSWENPWKLAGYSGGVSDHGDVIATYVTTARGGRKLPEGKFVVLRQDVNWKEEVLPIEHQVERVLFWKDFLVVASSDGEGKRYIALYGLTSLGKMVEVPGDVFVMR